LDDEDYEDDKMGDRALKDKTDKESDLKVLSPLNVGPLGPLGPTEIEIMINLVCNPYSLSIRVLRTVYYS
jgi:hypothetical protein